ncbi:efflux RND transporter periplasmic adaptor subunit [Spongiibacter taiwanensis]|uniref:efflux RND transporter periplasmic adaptor subunit n=1 Tax=Spongiibacter taiwanensis TaxID=1748242 RepID=UPI0020350661|nr:efflux RND transporter periplasmic adaptor subunit [Spongiibacter taiwanensis]USA43075.1 efflux RND transporter periplasmic adaptor subunit [Spongiibacter taiwanensis]
MTKRMVVMLLGTAAVFGGVFGMKWMSNSMMNDFIDAMPIPPVTISTALVEETSWPAEFTSVGTLVAVNGADLTAEMDGVVRAIHFESGDEVAKGALLVELDSAAEQGELDRLKAEAELAEIDRKRIETLFRRGSISQSELDTAAAKTKAAHAAVVAQQGRLDQKRVVAPFAGRLGIRQVNVGQYVAVGQTIVTLQSLNPIDVDFALPEKYLAEVAPGYPVQAKTETQQPASYQGKLIAMEPKVNPNTRNFALRARLENPDGVLKPGQFASIRVVLPEQKRYLTIPRSAVNYASYGSSVYVVQTVEGKTADDESAESDDSEAGPNKIVVQQFVKLGPSRGDYVAVIEGLSGGEEIASAGLLKLRSQQPVIVNNELAPSPSFSPNVDEG